MIIFIIHLTHRLLQVIKEVKQSSPLDDNTERKLPGQNKMSNLEFRF